MKAMIFAAGLGTRLKPFTDNKPKALFPVCGKPLLDHIIRKLLAAGFNDIVINVHHFSDLIIEYLDECAGLNVNIEISREQNLLDTGGGIKKVAGFFDDGKPFLVHNVDIISNVDLEGFYLSHLKRKDALASLLVNDRKSTRYFLMDDDRLAGWMNVVSGEIKSPFATVNSEIYRKMAFGGVHVMSPIVFEYMHNWPDKFSIIDFYLSVAAKISIYGFCPENLQLVDVGKSENLPAAELLCMSLQK
ncbi:MAG: nucleotidyltransferase family protein [Bacteroidales bacterium]|jgi:NDP-sugar pyrophosphorylase family protein|nr:nucleotidyltransferase family protein [Bacteroidales bacterium]